MMARRRHGIHARRMTARQARAGVARAVRLYLATQLRAGTCADHHDARCIGASFRAGAVSPVAAQDPARSYDPRPLPWWEKNGVTLGMGMMKRAGRIPACAPITRVVLARSCRDHRPQMVHVGAERDAFLVLAQPPVG
jgi:putative acyl-CoA dehydrogenase